MSYWYNLYCEKCINVHKYAERRNKTNARTVAELYNER